MCAIKVGSMCVLLFSISALTLALIESTTTTTTTLTKTSSNQLTSVTDLSSASSSPVGNRDAMSMIGTNTTPTTATTDDRSSGSNNNDNNILLWKHPEESSSTLIGAWNSIIYQQCVGLTWKTPTNHLYFQIGNGLLLLAFLAPNNVGGLLWLRCFISIGCILIIIWGLLIECSIDIILWFSLFLLVNFIHGVVLLIRLRPRKFDKEMEAVYDALFKPLRVSRCQFKKVLNCMKLVRTLKYQEVYAQEKVTKVDSLSLVLSGKLVVSQNQRALHIVFPHQFLDSPEWFGVSTDDFFQVSIMAMEESRVMIWHRDKLKLSIMTEPFLQVVFDHILGRDVVKKLMQVTQVSETMASNGFISAGYDDADEDKPMLQMKKSPDGHGLTALINRQLQDEHVPLLDHPPPCLMPHTSPVRLSSQRRRHALQSRQPDVSDSPC